MIVGTSLFSILVLLLDIFAIVAVLDGSNSAVSKILWILLILVFPILGVILWFLLGR
jgi:hypothetical protein